MTRKLFLTLIFIFLFLLITPSSSFAAIKTLNGQAGQDQIFSNDFNVGISSLNNIHTLFWNGLLPISRGGTGTGSFTDGSIPFISNGVFSENPQFTWQSGLNLNQGATLFLRNSDPAVNQGIEFTTSPVGSSGGDLFEIIYEPQLDALLMAGDLYSNGFAVDRTSSRSMAGEVGRLWPPEGTLSVVEGFNSTLYIGSTDAITDGQHTGCLVMGDSDGVGVTYITANDGVLTASTTKPNICQ